MTKTIVRAKRTTVDIAGIEIQGLMLPDGDYRMSNTDAGKAISVGSRQLGNFRNSTAFKALQDGGFQPGEITEVRMPDGRAIAKTSDLETIAAFWAYMSSSNSTAFALTVALATETITRRFDRAFDQQVTEEEYDAQLVLRFKRLDSRKLWTDVVRDRMVEHGYYQDRKRVSAEFRALTVKVNLALFDQPHFKCDRDTMNDNEQELIADFERACVRLSKKRPTALPAEIVDSALLLF